MPPCMHVASMLTLSRLPTSCLTSCTSILSSAALSARPFSSTHYLGEKGKFIMLPQFWQPALRTFPLHCRPSQEHPECILASSSWHAHPWPTLKETLCRCTQHSGPPKAAENGPDAHQPCHTDVQRGPRRKAPAILHVTVFTQLNLRLGGHGRLCTTRPVCSPAILPALAYHTLRRAILILPTQHIPVVRTQACSRRKQQGAEPRRAHTASLPVSEKQASPSSWLRDNPEAHTVLRHGCSGTASDMCDSGNIAHRPSSLHAAAPCRAT